MISKIPARWCAVGDRRSGLPRLAINMKILDVQQSGTAGTMVSYKTRYGQLRRRYVVPRDPQTALQLKRRKTLGRVRFLWRTLTDAQRAAWNAMASAARTRRRLSQSGRLSGYLLFVKINCNRALVGQEITLDPSAAPAPGANPVRQIVISNTNGAIALKLSVSGKPAQFIVVLGTRPRSAGASYADHFTILDVLPTPERGMSDITELFVSKYGLPPVGSRVFIRTFQLIDGWEDLPLQVSAVVPVG
jgi:hypothetical protein